MQSIKFYHCSKCGAIIYTIQDCPCNCLSCCNQKMELLIPNKADALKEKHIPIINKNDICVGSELHPMLDNHYIEWICIKNNDNVFFYHLKPAYQPVINVSIDHNAEVYAYCNLHGLWCNK